MPDSAMLVARYAGPVWVTLGLVLYYYASILNVLRVKNRLGREYRARNETFDRYLSNDRQMLTADRVQLNTLEQMPPFLILLWLDASLVNPQHATIAGVIYLAARFLYPFVLGRQVGAVAPWRLMPLTFTGYAVIAFFSVELVLATLRGHLG